MIPLLIIIGIILNMIHDTKDFYKVFFSTTLAMCVTYTLKYLCKVPRPSGMLVTETDYRFPSAHATIAAVTAVLIAYYAKRHVKSKAVRVLIYIFSLLWFVLVSYSRLYLHVHLPIDIIVGRLIGVLSTFTVLHMFKHLHYYSRE
jgi:undecaprenyl-diphosphatase